MYHVFEHKCWIAANSLITLFSHSPGIINRLTFSTISANFGTISPHNLTFASQKRYCKALYARRAIASVWGYMPASQSRQPTCIILVTLSDWFFYSSASCFCQVSGACGFLLDIPKNHLSVQGGEVIVKINRVSFGCPWTPMPWLQAKVEYEQKYSTAP